MHVVFRSVQIPMFGIEQTIYRAARILNPQPGELK